MVTRESLFARAFWRGQIDARPLALFRIVLGGLIFYDLIDRLRDFRVFYTDEGVLPWTVAFQVRGAWELSLFDLPRTPSQVALLYAVGTLFSLALLLGYHTRLAALATWLFLSSLQVRNPLLFDGSDGVLRAMCFWLLFADAGARFSLDARLRRQPPRAFVPAYPVGLLRIQFALIYLATAVSKIQGGWLRKNLLFGILQTEWLVRGAGPWLHDHPGLCRALTPTVVWIELAIPLVLLSPIAVKQMRWLGLLLNLALHAAIFATLSVGNFPLVMVGVSVIFFLPEWLGPIAHAEQPARPPSWPMAIACALMLAVAVQIGLGQRRMAGFGSYGDALMALGLRQHWPMFSQGLAGYLRWHVPGRLSDGSTRDVLRAAAPRMAPQPAGWGRSRWVRFAGSIAAYQSHEVDEAFLDYICRSYPGDARLEEVRLVYEVVPTARPGRPPPSPPPDTTLYRKSCPRR